MTLVDEEGVLAQNGKTAGYRKPPPSCTSSRNHGLRLGAVIDRFTMSRFDVSQTPRSKSAVAGL